MTSKIEGNAPDNTRIIVFDENDWSIESNTVESGDYSVGGLADNNKLVVGRSSSGEVKSYGNVEPVAADPVNITIYVGNSADDGYADVAGTYINNTLTRAFISGNTPANPQTVYLRFSGVSIPPGSTIQTAYIRWMWGNTRSSPTPSCPIQMEDVSNATAITSYADYASRTMWDTGARMTSNSYSGQWHNDKSIINGVQRIVDKPGWASGNAIQVFYGPYAVTGQWAIYTINGGYAPELHVTYV